MVPFEKSTIMRKRSSSTADLMSKSAPLTINEEDIPGKDGNGSSYRRAQSLPPLAFGGRRTIMRYKTLDESLSSTYSVERKEDERRITLASVQIREYARTVGDNPSCSSGPPVSISWEYNLVGEFGLDEYEESHPNKRSQMEMVIPRTIRQDMLRHEWGVSHRQMADAVRENVKVKNQRRTTVNNLGKASAMEQAMEKLGRKVKRTLTFQKSISRQVKELSAMHDEANRLRQQQVLETTMAAEYDSASTKTEDPTDDNVVEDEYSLSQESDGSVSKPSPETIQEEPVGDTPKSSIPAQ